MKMNSRYFPILIFAVLAFGIILGSWLNFPSPNRFSETNNAKNKLNKLIDFIDNEYVDDVNTDSIVAHTVDSILAQLDPHSVYIPPSEQAEVVESMKGDFVGIGVNFYMLNDTVTIVKSIEDGPSEKAGIQSGDRILYANKTKLFGRKLPNDSLYAILKGDIGSSVSLIIYRKSLNKKLLIRLKRDVVSI